MLVALAAIWAFFAWQEPVFQSARNLSLLSHELAAAVAAVLVFWHDVPAPIALLLATPCAVLVWAAISALIMASLLNGMTLTVVSPEAKHIACGIVLALAVWLNLRPGKDR